MPTQTLRGLERGGLLTRTVYCTVPTIGHTAPAAPRACGGAGEGRSTSAQSCAALDELCLSGVGVVDDAGDR